MLNTKSSRTASAAILLLAASALGFSCSSRAQYADDVSAASDGQSAPEVRTGAEVLFEDKFRLLRGKRIGAIVNQASVIDTVHVVDAMLSAGVNVTALFGPEHGVRGEAGAGVVIDDDRDARTGLPVFSLYGATRKPDPSVLAELDVLVFDIQDVGARFYTYISTMGLAMQAAAESGIEFLVLDRPNPLGGDYVSGFVLEPGFESFVGLYPIPVAHGLTVGELAKAIAGEQWLDGLEALRLTVVPMKNWRRSMRWPATGKTWIPTSPNIPNYATASVYPGMCFMEAANVAEGRGTAFPFLQFGAPWIEAGSFARRLNETGAPGVSFSPVTFTPKSIASAAPNPRLRDTEVHGARIDISSDGELDPLRLGIEVLVALREASAGTSGDAVLFREASMRRLAGTDRLLESLNAGRGASEIAELWQDEVAAFRVRRQPYLIY